MIVDYFAEEVRTGPAGKQEKAISPIRRANEPGVGLGW
jgi:hypothetical protein